MEFKGTYYDGQVALARSVICTINGLPNSGSLMIRELDHQRVMTHWRLPDIVPVSAKKGQLRLGCNAKPVGARLVFSDPETAARLSKTLPVLSLHRRRQRGAQVRVVGLATLAMASLVVAYIFGIPLLAGRIVGLIPAEMETRLGETVVAQLDLALAEQGGLVPCDPDPQSVANRAIMRFARAAIAQTGSPFDIDVQVVANSIPNAFALPGGRTFYFQGLLQKTQSSGEFAGVLAHEIGHVVYRDGMQQLVATAGTGLLVGFVLGDISGLSIAGGIGAALIDTSFSRDAERRADRFALETAARQAFDPLALGNLLQRISRDDAMSQKFALLSTHPLTQERRIILGASKAFKPALNLRSQRKNGRPSRPCAPVAGRPSPNRNPADGVKRAVSKENRYGT